MENINIDLIIFSSGLHNKKELYTAREPLFERLKAVFNLSIIDANDYIKHQTNYNTSSIKVIFIASGGSEETFLNIFPILKEPFIILSDPYHNSLAASFEICSWLEQRAIKHSLLTVPLDFNDDFIVQLQKFVSTFYKNETIKDKLRDYRIGTIGGYSNWLIASHVSGDTILKKYHIILEEIPTTELIDKYTELKARNANLYNDAIFIKYKKLLAGGVSQEYLCDAILMYYALKQVCELHELKAITIKCFDLIGPCKTTACIALAMLNDDGIIAGCEGDIPTLFTLIWLNLATGKLGFMANPSSIDKANLSVDFSHCTIPLSLIKSYTLPTHFESNIGVGIQGNLPLGRYTVLKIGGKELDKMISCKGELIECPYMYNRCRTQVRFKFDTEYDFNKFVNNRLGNHIIIAKGDIEL